MLLAFAVGDECSSDARVAQISMKVMALLELLVMFAEAVNPVILQDIPTTWSPKSAQWEPLRLRSLRLRLTCC